MTEVASSIPAQNGVSVWEVVLFDNLSGFSYLPRSGDYLIPFFNIFG